MTLSLDSAPSSFRDEVLDIAQQLYMGREPPFVRGTDANEIVHGDRHIYLDNLYAWVRLLPSDKREMEIRDWLGHVGPEGFAKFKTVEVAADDWSHAKPLLRPMLQAHAVVDRFETIIQRPFSPELIVTYAIDVGHANAYVMKRKLSAWSVQIDDVHNVAVANLEGMSTNLDLVPESWGRAPGTFLIVESGDSYDASRLLLPGFRALLLAAMGPTLRASVPDRNALFVWTPDFPYHQAIATAVREDAAKRPYALSDETFEFDSSGLRLARTLSRLQP